MNATFQQVLAKAIEDEAFSQKLQENPDETLKPYDLAVEEVAALKALQPQMLEALRLRDEATSDSKTWRKPASFREAGAAILSAILVLLLLYAAWATFSQVAAKPLTYNIDDNVQVVDTFERAKDLLNIFFPLFGAVVTFWLGVTVEGRRADRNEAKADQAKNEKEAAEVESRETRIAATEALDEAEAVVLEQMKVVGSGTAFERGGASAPSANQAQLQNALKAILTARRQISR